MSKERKYSDFIRDILQAIQDIYSITKGKTYDDFCNDIAIYRSTERLFEIIGEAANRIPKKIQDQYQEIPWKDIIGMKNIVMHAYDRVETDILWDTLSDDLPKLVDPLKKLLEDMEKLEERGN